LFPDLGPFKVFSTKLCWAHSRLSVANFVAYAGPIQGVQHQNVLGPLKALGSKLYWAHSMFLWPFLGALLGPFKTFGSQFHVLCWAHSRFLAATYGDHAGPIKAFGSTSWIQKWAHSRHSAANSGGLSSAHARLLEAILATEMGPCRIFFCCSI